jgi:hypothetical protein
MSERKRPRLGKCKMCRQPAVIAYHGKCVMCRFILMRTRVTRYREQKQNKGKPTCGNTSNG